MKVRSQQRVHPQLVGRNREITVRKPQQQPAQPNCAMSRIEPDPALSHALLGGHPLPGHPALIDESKAVASYNMQETQPSTSVPSSAIWRNRM